MPAAKRDANAEYLAEHIPNARFFDIDAPGFADHKSPLPHMLPSATEFAHAARKLGVRNEVPVVVYAKHGFKGAARSWWMFRLFGKDDVFLLDGGLNAWKDQGKAVESGKGAEVKEGDFSCRVNEGLVRSMDDMLAQIQRKDGYIIDARPQHRFDGSTPEPRKGLASGHMPGAYCVPCDALVEHDGRLKEVKELRNILRQRGLDVSLLEKGPVSLTCGSGVTAAINCVALYELGIDAAVYDGSWTEYGAYENNPIESA